MTHAYDDAAIERLARRVVDRTLPKPEWTHAAHIAATLWWLRHQPDRTGPDAMRGLITGYNEATGTANTDTSGYHHTITRASVRALSDHLSHYGAEASLATVLSDVLLSPLGSPGWLLTYWDKDRLFNPDARRSWVEPNLAALPF